MKNIIISISLFGILMSLSGCYSASPQFIRGNYYITGDDNCRSSYFLDAKNTKIMCYNSDGEPKGYRHAMTDQQLQMYRFNKQQEQRAWDSINQSIKSIGDSYKEQANTYNSILKNQRQRPNTTIVYPDNYKGLIWNPI